MQRDTDGSPWQRATVAGNKESRHEGLRSGPCGCRYETGFSRVGAGKVA